METFAEAFEEAGFDVPTQERLQPSEVDKAIGYRILRQPAMLCLPQKKLFPLEQALMRTSHMKMIDAEIVRALVGLYNFGALLNRCLLSIPHAVYTFLEKCAHFSR